MKALNDDLRMVLERLATYSYGILYDDGKFVSDKDEMDRRDGTDIVVQTPEMMDSHKAGMCHDASIYVDKVLTELGIEHKCIYIASNVEPMLPTHSFIIAREEDGNWMIIDVFACKDCIWSNGETEFDEAVNSRVAKWIVDDNGGSEDLEVFMLNHMPDGGCGFVEWTEKVSDSVLLHLWK